MTFLQILPMAIVMVAGPQLLSSFFLATSEGWKLNSAAYVLGAALSIAIVVTAAYLLGIGVQVPFIVTTLYTGPVGSALNGVDLSWIVGLVVVTPVYYVGAKRFRSAHSRVNQAAGLVSDEVA